MESTPKEKTGVKPRRRICDKTDTPPAASAAELVPNVLGFLFFGAYQQRREGDPDGQPRFSISSVQACTLERILQCHLMVSTQHGKQQLPVISLTA